ncbi:membrane lipoprotein [Artemisia annua]|uniref:Membrane lipoprotein n=1 Tax=Artemisia annua TaxID=35608 RepID=A0A2U1MVZ3_ARTAN|nr:membrane lipoprotein [Artemisia annua]
MRSSSSVGLGLSLVFGCLLLALIAELYYLLWWKKRVTNREIQESCNSPAKEFLYLFCWKKPSSLSSTGLVTDTQVHEPQSASWFRPHGQGFDDINVDNELLRLQGLAGPPRFLFTIKEETKEDMESEDKSKKGSSRGRSLSDVVFAVDTPFFTPLASPSFMNMTTPPITPRDSTYRPFSPLRHSSSDAEFNRIWASPPPKFKFLRDAEDKLEKRKLIERFGVDGCVQKSDEYNGVKDDENGSFITLVVSKGNEIGHQFPSSSSQVLPLAASPPTFRSQFYMNPGLE